MTGFSASDAALEGFNLIRRRWRVVLGWAGFNLLVLVMMVVLTVVTGLVAAATGAGAQTPAVIAMGLVAALCTLALQAILMGGVFRLEMRPEEPAFLHLRLGRDELRLVVVWLITITGAWVVGWLAALAVKVLHVPGLLTGPVVLVAIIYLAVRFSLAAPVAFAERRIDFPRSWRLTRGATFALLGMNALSFCLIALLMIVVLLVLTLIAAGAAGLEGVAGLFGGRTALQSHPGLYLLEFAVEIVLTPVLWILGLAPNIAAYRALAGEPTRA